MIRHFLHITALLAEIQLAQCGPGDGLPDGGDSLRHTVLAVHSGTSRSGQWISLDLAGPWAPG